MFPRSLERRVTAKDRWRRGRLAYPARTSADAPAAAPGSTESPSPSFQRVGDIVRVGAAEHGGGLHARSRGHLLRGAGHENGSATEVGEQLPVRTRPSSPADEDQPAIGWSERTQRIQAVEQPADDSLDGGAGELLTGRRRCASR